MSEALNTGATGTCVQETVILAGKALSIGGILSATVMVCVAVDLLPQASVAVQVRVMV